MKMARKKVIRHRSRGTNTIPLGYNHKYPTVRLPKKKYKYPTIKLTKKSKAKKVQRIKRKGIFPFLLAAIPAMIAAGKAAALGGVHSGWRGCCTTNSQGCWSLDSSQLY